MGTCDLERGKWSVYRSVKIGRKTTRQIVGFMGDDLVVKDAFGKVIGLYQKPGVLDPVAKRLYGDIARVWKMDNELAAHWASWSFPREHKDLKVLLCAFMLVQSRKGDPVVEDGKILFHDEDYRNVGEAMSLIRAKDDMNPKLLLRVGQVLKLPSVAQINREMGFNKSARNPAIGRYYRVVEKWLRYRENNLPMLEGLVKAGFRSSTIKLAQMVGYKPNSPLFFDTLRWKQVQSKQGHRTMAIGKKVKKAESWVGKSEEDICKIIMSTKPGWKRIAGLLPKEVGMTAAIVAAAVEAGCLSNPDLIIMTPTLEELGLLNDKDVKKKWDAAIAGAENQRAAHIAKNVKTKVAKEGLQEAVDKATVKALEEVTKDLRVYVIIDKSGSMQGALDRACVYLTKFLGGFPLDRLHVSVFNTVGKEITIKAPKAAAVKNALIGETAGGGTCYAEGVRALIQYQPRPNEDTLIIFIGDEGDQSDKMLADTVLASGLNPMAFGILPVVSDRYGRGDVVHAAAKRLGIPCFQVDEGMFTSDDPYAVTRMFKDLIASTPVTQNRVVKNTRKTLIEEILETPLLQIPLAFAKVRG
jgi:hypothetical protein